MPWVYFGDFWDANYWTCWGSCSHHTCSSKTLNGRVLSHFLTRSRYISFGTIAFEDKTSRGHHPHAFWKTLYLDNVQLQDLSAWAMNVFSSSRCFRSRVLLPGVQWAVNHGSWEHRFLTPKASREPKRGHFVGSRAIRCMSDVLNPMYKYWERELG